MVESHAPAAACALFSCTQGKPLPWRDGGCLFGHSYKLLSAKAQHRQFLVHFNCTVLPMLFHSGPSGFFDLFPHFSGVSLFLLLIEMPGYNQQLSSIILAPPPHCSSVWFSSGPCLVFTFSYLAGVALMQVRQEQRLLRGRESRQTGLIWNSRRLLVRSQMTLCDFYCWKMLD